MSFFKKPIASILIICLIGLISGPVLLYPGKTEAVGCPTSIVTSAPEVKSMGIKSSWEALQNSFRVGELSKSTITASKLIWDTGKKLVTWGKNQFMNLLLHQLLSMITNDIVNWIQNGGKPRFLSMGLDRYLLQAADVAGVNFIDQYLGAGWLCEPFDLEIKLALLNVPKAFGEEARCSFSDIGHNLEDFYNNFANGGWRGWVKVTEPRNNFYGAFLIAQDEYNRVKSEAEEEAEKDAMMGEGFLSPKDCTWYDANGNVVAQQIDILGTPTLPEECKPANAGAAGVTPPCRDVCQTKTPSSVVSEMAKKASTNFYDELNAQIAGATAAAGPYQIYITAITNALINRVMKEGLSLIGIGNSPPVYSPLYGDTGASVDIPKLLNPEDVIQYKDNSFEIKKQLDLLKENIEDNLLKEQKENLSVLKTISDAYTDNIPVLENVITQCNACNRASCNTYVLWAQDKISEINNSTTPEFNQRINNIETNDIPKSLAWINDINTAINLSQNYMEKADEWIIVYEKVAGEEGNAELNAAELALNSAEDDLIKNIQKIIQGINGAVASSDVENLNDEVQDANITIITTSTNLSIERGTSTWPDVGTLYAELEAAYDLKTEANTNASQCKSWSSSGTIY